MTRIALALAMVAALTSSARAGSDVGVIVTGEGSIQPQVAAQMESWLSQHGHPVIPSPLPPDGITALVDCLVMNNHDACGRDIVDKRSKSSAMVYVRVNTQSNANGTRDVTLTAYWFDRGHDAVTQTKTCERCTDTSLRTTADDIMRKLVGGGEVGHIKLSSNPAGARISIDGQPIGVTPLDWDLPPGKHTIQMDKAGLRPATRDILVVSNKLDAVGMVLLPPGTAPVPGDEPSDTRPSRILPFAALGVGGAAIITGIILVAIDEDPGPKEHPQIYDTAKQGVGFLIGGAVVAGVGAYLLFRSPATTSAPVAAISSDSAYVGWLGHF